MERGRSGAKPVHGVNQFDWSLPSASDSQPIETHEDAIYAGAIGAALWGAFRHKKLADMARAA